MKKATTANKIAALRHAKKELEMTPIGSFLGVCGALPIWNPSTPQLCRYISDQLNGHAFLNQWLRKHRPNIPRDNASVRQYRLQWIDWMIACLEGKEPAPPNT